MASLGAAFLSGVLGGWIVSAGWATPPATPTLKDVLERHRGTEEVRVVVDDELDCAFAVLVDGRMHCCVPEDVSVSPVAAERRCVLAAVADEVVQPPASLLLQIKEGLPLRRAKAEEGVQPRRDPLLSALGGALQRRRAVIRAAQGSPGCAPSPCTSSATASSGEGSDV